MGRFIVRYRGKGARPERAVHRLREADGVQVIDETRRMLLVEGPEKAIRSACGDDDDWVVEPEQVYRLPDPRPSIKRRPR